jgi:riboflavin synthase
MFTGLIEAVGIVRSTEVRADGRRIVIDASPLMDDLAIGDSIAVDGVCQTVVERNGRGFAIDSIATTLSRTTLGALQPGTAVNLERALQLGGRLGGHLVQGHVDATGVVVAIERAGQHVLLDVEMPDDVADVTVLHGSIAIQGVSLTVNGLPARNRAQVALIPHTCEQTTLRHLRVGDRVNLEGDMIGRFVAHLLRRGAD